MSKPANTSTNPIGERLRQLSASLQAFRPSAAEQAELPPTPANDFNRSANGYARAIYLAIVIGFLGALLALVSIPISSGVVSGGRVVVATSRKAVQHLEGGIVEKVMVQEGQLVAQGQPLLKLHDTALRTVWTASDERYWDLLTSRARLRALQNLSPVLVWPEEVRQAAGRTEVADMMRNQEVLFRTARREMQAEAGVLVAQTAQASAAVASVEAQASTAQGRLALLQGRLDELKPLYDKGFITRARILELEADTQATAGAIRQYDADRQRAGQAVTEARLKLAETRAAQVARYAAQADAVDQELTELQGRRGQAEDALERSIVRAPAAGRVMGLNAQTEGGVITPGEKVAEIVPTAVKLIVEAAIDPREITHVTPGRVARVRLTGVHARNLPDLTGDIVSVTPDVALPPPGTETPPHFIARVEIDPRTLGPYRHIPMTPGMPAQVTVEGGKRTALQYLVGPLNDMLTRTFKEY